MSINIKPVHRVVKCLPGLYSFFFYQFIDIIHLHDFSLQLYQKFINLGNHKWISGGLWEKKVCAHFFLKNFFHAIFKIVDDLRRL